MKDLKVIAFFGRDKVGKSTFAHFMKEHLGEEAVEIPSATPIIDDLTRCYGIPRDMFIDQEGKNSFVRLGDFPYTGHIFELFMEYDFARYRTDFENTEIMVRDLMILHSVHIRRKEDPDYFVKLYQEKLDNLPSSVKYVINDGAMMPNEIEALNEMDSSFFFLAHHPVSFQSKDMKGKPFSNPLEKSVMEYIIKHMNLFMTFGVPIPITKEVFEEFLPVMITEIHTERDKYGRINEV